MEQLNRSLRRKLTAFAETLVDNSDPRTIVQPKERKPGYWFGSGNAAVGPDGAIYVTGRYRNHGDSRTGVGAGERGLEFALYRAEAPDGKFEKCMSFSKADLNSVTGEVVSIEGSTIHFDREGVELFISTEKSGLNYPEEIRHFQKPGTGRWTIDRLSAPSIEELSSAPIDPVVRCDDPRFLHVKDPLLLPNASGRPHLGFCTHPFNWSSANSAVARRSADGRTFEKPNYTVFRRGFTWDVAISRITGTVRVPQVGPFREVPRLTLVFYDGGECMRNLDEHSNAVKRPRGYSCEELGGLAVMVEDDLDTLERLSIVGPAFVSPNGTGCSRYVDVMEREDGYFVTWQQSQSDRSQPLVGRWVPRETAEAPLQR